MIKKEREKIKNHLKMMSTEELITFQILYSTEISERILLAELRNIKNETK